MSMHLDYAGATLSQHKVPIPRLQRASHGHGPTKDRRRVPRACTGCRSHKVKCTGERPRCKHCAATDRECVYIMPRKDRLKIVTERFHQMTDLLKELRTSANAHDDARIKELLAVVQDDATELKSTTATSNAESEAQDDLDGTEIDAVEYPAELDTESLDLLDEDLHHEGARATGFVGKNSEIQWLRTVALAQTELLDRINQPKSSSRRDSYALGVGSICTFSYWADSDGVDIDYSSDQYELPPPETAERLLQCYMTTVHDSFPILPRKPFENQFRVYFKAVQNQKALRLSPKWQSILNLVLAIGARYSHIVKAPWRADDRDHLIYQGRARRLGINEAIVSSHSDIPQIQGFGLLAFYWLSVGQVNRAWTIIGIALRSAYSLGLHVRNEDPFASAAKKETLVQTWWSLYSLERTLSIITGRPSIIIETSCSVPLPMPIPEDRISERLDSTETEGYRMATAVHEAGLLGATPGFYFRSVIQLSIISQNILTSLYSAGTIIRSPRDVQQDVAKLDQRLGQWICALPIDLDIQQNFRLTGELARERMLLAFQFYSARMLLGRPYLTGGSQFQSEHNEETFAKRMANSSVEAAKSVVWLLQDSHTPEIIYSKGPWWCIVHHLMQAISIFLLGLSFPQATSQNSATLIAYTKTSIQWLQKMQDSLAERASEIALSTFLPVAHRHSVDISALYSQNTRMDLSIQQQQHIMFSTFPHT